jgi:hypothetical protein
MHVAKYVEGDVMNPRDLVARQKITNACIIGCGEKVWFLDGKQPKLQ